MNSIDPSEILVAALVPGMEDFFTDWTKIPIEESPNFRFLQGDEIPYRILMYSEVGAEKIQMRVDRFRVLKASVRRSGIKEPVTLVQRPDGRYLSKNGNHRAAIALYLGIREIPCVVWPLERLLVQIEEMSARDPHYRDWIGPMRRRIATAS